MADMGSGQLFDTLERKANETITRVSAVERDIAALKVDFACVQTRLDHIDQRLDRMERRTGLVDTTP